MNDYRPQTLSEIVGQNDAKKMLSVLINSFHNTGKPLGHMLMLGPSGVGKTTLSSVLSHELGRDMFYRMAPKINKIEDLYDVFNHIEEGDIFFIDEIHALNSKVQEMLYEVMEDFQFRRKTESGKYSTIKESIPKFTLIGATTHPGKLNMPLRGRFKMNLFLEFYSVRELATLIINAAKKAHGINNFPNNVAIKLATLSKSNARCAINILDNFVQILGATKRGNIMSADIKMQYINTLVNLLSVDPIIGLDRISRNYLEAIETENRPLGPEIVATLINEQECTVKDMIEPFLLSKINIKTSVNGVIYDINGPLVKATKGGRDLTELGHTYLNACRQLGVKF